MYTYDDLIFENQNAKILCNILYTINPDIFYPRGYITEAFAVSFYNFLKKDNKVLSQKNSRGMKVCYVPIYNKYVS